MTMRVELHCRVYAKTGEDLTRAGLELPLVLNLEDHTILRFEAPTGDFEYYGPVVLHASMSIDASTIEIVDVPCVRTGPEEDSPPAQYAVTPETNVLDERSGLALDSIAFLRTRSSATTLCLPKMPLMNVFLRNWRRRRYGR
jgi:hypothetical protein